MKYRRMWWLGLVILVFSFSCDQDDAPVSENEYVNNWILENMQFWYYWNLELPGNPNQTLAPEPFFESLLSNSDRFSWIQEDFQELLASLQGVNKEAGYEFVLYQDGNNPGNVLAQILYVKTGSPAAASGLKRGDIIDKINNQQLTESNYQSVLGQIGEPHTITFRPLIDFTSFGAATTISLATVEIAENPNFLSEIYTYGDKKIGYYVYNLFSTGPTNTSTTYNEEMDEIFTSFKAQGITDLIVDLRYNSGGAESATQNLASLIGKGVNNTKIFTKRQYNSQVNNEIINDPELGSSFLEVKFLNKTQNIGNQLTRVYILTGSRTASASELLINGLTPFMDVVLIGRKTVGKNVGSVTLYEENDARNTWGMQPIVVRSFNSLDQSDYSNGFIPNIEDLDNSLALYPLGDPRERLLNIALEEITGTPVNGRRGPAERFDREVLATSFDSKAITNQLIIDPAVSRALQTIRKRKQ
jgi:carboxyl-terminal processing protease